MSFVSRFAVVLTVAVALFAPSSSLAMVNGPATLDVPDRAIRVRTELPALDPARGRITVVGDSILFSRLNPGARTNRIVPIVAEALASRYPHMSVSNRSVPGLSTVSSIGPMGTTLRSYLINLLDTAEPRPQIVVVAVSSIDLNLALDVDVDAIAPSIIAELRAVERLMRRHDITPVFAPAFGINGHMYNVLRSIAAPYQDYRLDERVNEFNDLLMASGLPLLLRRYSNLDMDTDGNADRRYFIGNDPTGRWPDDGIHPNALGEHVFGSNLAEALIAAFER